MQAEYLAAMADIKANARPLPPPPPLDFVSNTPLAPMPKNLAGNDTSWWTGAPKVFSKNQVVHSSSDEEESTSAELPGKKKVKMGLINYQN